MDVSVTVDCVTHAATRVPLTAEQQAQRAADAAERDEQVRALIARVEHRDLVLGKLAVAADVSVDDVKQALNPPGRRP